MTKTLKFRPYARLLTMLGDQLIKNERIALVELIKNAYDADASWVKITFKNFGDSFEPKANSKIIIEDDGAGMTRDVLERHWVSPATPVKKKSKQEKATTSKGRVIQGEKGIGRFALFKLGKKVTITSRPTRSSSEFTLKADFSSFDDEFLVQNDKEVTPFLDELNLELSESGKAEVIVAQKYRVGARDLPRALHGTKIEISHLKGTWSEQKVRNVYKDINRLQSIFSDLLAVKDKEKDPFEVVIFKDESYQNYSDQYIETLQLLLKHSSVIRIENGEYNQRDKKFTFLMEKKRVELPLSDPDFAGQRIAKDYLKVHGDRIAARGTQCGSFNFGFYVFDFSATEGKYALEKDEKDLVKENRIYLYRDGVRVYPYGDPEDDWLQVDAYRGTIGAGQFLSNDQVVGVVNITQKANPDLADKTNREGLLETGYPIEDFIWLLQAFLQWVRKKPYAIYRENLKTKKDLEVFKKEKVREGLAALEKAVKGNKSAESILSSVSAAYRAERNYLVHRAETTEHLAGVGLSVETATHDLMAMMGKALLSIDTLTRETQRRGELNKDHVHRELSTLRGMLSFIETQLKDIQLLFRSTKQRRKDIRVEEILRKVERVFANALRREKIEFDLVKKGPPLIAKSTDAVLLQLLINLFDNSLYWVPVSRESGRKIEVLLDGDEGNLIFSDNGPGVKPEDRPYIFEPFYSGRGEDGRGLGLYIAKQLLERHDYSIELAEVKAHKRLAGANFVISFVRGEE